MTTAAPTYTVERIDHRAEAVVKGPDGSSMSVPVHALPGEMIVDGRCDGSSPDRIEPACRHFEACGGCVAQHMSPAFYARWKTGLVAQALRAHGLAPAIDPLITVSPRTRRRAKFSVTTKALGFHAAAEATVIDLAECPVVTAKIEAALPRLRELISLLGAPNDETRIAVADLHGGLDVVVTELKSELTAGRRSKLANFAASHGFARLTIGDETVVTHADPRLVTSSGSIVAPPDSFFQAVAEAETAIVAAVLAGLPKVKRVADLFCGLGTLSLPLARVARVLAVDTERRLLDALVHATRHTQGLKPIEALRRDLFREPLSAKELEGIDAVVLDPPFAGARAQCERLAASKVKSVVMVSCHPGTLARDAKVLVGGGFDLLRVTPIDQFLWSNHVECVAVFRR